MDGFWVYGLLGIGAFGYTGFWVYGLFGTQASEPLAVTNMSPCAGWDLSGN
jgi:hypothetical protein